MSPSNFRNVFNELKSFIPPNRLFDDKVKTFAYGTDASFYRLTPKLVVKIDNDEELKQLLKSCSYWKIPVTFRTAGTSLSGQAITDSILVTFTETYNNFEVTENGNSIKLRPGVIGSKANQTLAKFNKKIGPDPASINACKIGGIVANNASGMTSGIKNNAYNTLENITIIFADGTKLDTSNPESRKNFLKQNSELVNEIRNISEQIKSNQQLNQFIENKFKLKNTCGYGLNSLQNFADPIDIIAHLMIGSEGTLGFISEVTLRTVDNFSNRATSLIIFKTINDACNSVQNLDHSLAEAVELMDYASLISVKDKPSVPEYLHLVEPGNAALLVETSTESQIILKSNIEKLTSYFSDFAPRFSVEFTEDKNKYVPLWNVRKGLFPTACKNRTLGTTVIIEDINFPVNKLAEAVEDLQSVLIKHHYNNAIIWGHALSGNIHFVLFQNFAEKKEIKRYNNFLNELSDLVIKKYNGSLKSEHGTGRNMAPFVIKEWGQEAYAIMCKIKKIFDPENILNPGVIINEKKDIHLKNLKDIPITNPLIDQCIECGFCEPICPSKNLTLTPRHRIALWRNYFSQKKQGTINKNFIYDFEQTCATDGLCSTSCPVDIDTGKLIKEFRNSTKNKTALSLANLAISKFDLITSSLRIGLKIISISRTIFGEKNLQLISRSLSFVSSNKIPRWNKSIPNAAKKNIHKNKPSKNRKNIIYFPSCISRTLGNYHDERKTPDQTEIILDTLERAGFNIIIPENREQLCCGMPLASKGFQKQSKLKSAELANSLFSLSKNGSLPILFDTSPCSLHMKEYLKEINNFALRIYSPTEFITDILLEQISLEKQFDSVTLHLTCSERKMGLEKDFKLIGNKCSNNVIIPEEVNCCGFAGDRGFTHPELNTSALASLKNQIPKDCKNGYSTSRTCEIGLTKNSGIKYNSIFYLINRCIKN